MFLYSLTSFNVGSEPSGFVGNTGPNKKILLLMDIMCVQLNILRCKVGSKANIANYSDDMLSHYLRILKWNEQSFNPETVLDNVNPGLKFKPRFEKLMCTWLAIQFGTIHSTFLLSLYGRSVCFVVSVFKSDRASLDKIRQFIIQLWTITWYEIYVQMYMSSQLS